MTDASRLAVLVVYSERDYRRFIHAISNGMTRDRWDDVVAMIKDTFTVIADGSEPNVDGPGRTEFIEFDGPLGRMRCEYDTHPKVLGKRAIGGHKVGSGGKIQYDYSDSEETATLFVYKKNGSEWEEMDASMFGA